MDRTEMSGRYEGEQVGTPLIEWVSSGVGPAVTLVMLGFLGYKTVVGNDSPPQIAIRVDHIFNVSGGYLVDIAVVNRGHSTASQLKVEGELKAGTDTIETSDATFDYVPARSEREGGLFFTRDPRSHELSLRATGYVKP